MGFTNPVFKQVTNGWLRLRKIDFRSESFVSRMFLLAKKSIFLCLAHPFVATYLPAGLVILHIMPLWRSCISCFVDYLMQR
jgi:hypothetical protein